ncbi:hypothetical protein [Roseibium sp. M-1]
MRAGFGPQTIRSNHDAITQETVYSQQVFKTRRDQCRRRKRTNGTLTVADGNSAGAAIAIDMQQSQDS